MKAVTEGRLTHSLDQNRYLLDGESAFAQLATLIRASLPGAAILDGRDFGKVRITIEVIDDDTRIEGE